MKVFLLFYVAIFVSLPVTAQNQKRWTVKRTPEKEKSRDAIRHATVSEIFNDDFRHFENVIVEGQLVYRVAERGFVLSDATGEVLVQLTRAIEYKLGDQALLGSAVKVLAVVKKRFLEEVILEIVQAKVSKPSEILGL